MQAQASLSESSQRLDLIRHSLELRNKELPPQQSGKSMELKRELESYSVSSPTPSSTYVSLQPFKSAEVTSASTTSSTSQPLGKSAAITGKLEVRLMGCQDLLEDVPGRSRRDSTHSAPNDLKSFVKGKFNRIQPHCIGIRASGSNRTEPELIIELKLKRCDGSELFQVVQRQGRDEQRDLCSFEA